MRRDSHFNPAVTAAEALQCGLSQSALVAKCLEGEL